ncbi:hypothetical protein A2U01_0073319, partial [Trifolium medium]|nr:hypothetical protein [Trifolium medium]
MLLQSLDASLIITNDDVIDIRQANRCKWLAKNARRRL